MSEIQNAASSVSTAKKTRKGKDTGKKDARAALRHCSQENWDTVDEIINPADSLLESITKNSKLKEYQAKVRIYITEAQRTKDGVIKGTVEEHLQSLKVRWITLRKPIRKEEADRAQDYERKADAGIKSSYLDEIQRASEEDDD